VTAVASVLEWSGLDARLLVLEVTETVMVAEEAELRRTLRALRDLGVELAIDDFGTGYSSLASLGELPVGTLKIAKPFIDRLGHSPQQEAFAAAIIALGQTLGLTLVAEGIEHRDQAERLTDLRCPLGQGFLFGRPVSAEELQTRLAG